MAPVGIDQALDRISVSLDRIEGKVDDVDARVASALVRPAAPVPFAPGATSVWPLPVRGSSGMGRNDGAGLRAGGAVGCGCIGCRGCVGA